MQFIQKIRFLHFQFEAQLLSGRKIKDENDALEAMKVLHDKGVKIVILSSTDFSDSGESITLASRKLENGTFEKARIVYPTLPVHFVGTGDLFTALTTAWLQHGDFHVASALEKTIATMQTVLQRTLAFAKEKAKGSNPSPGQLELKLIQSREDILKPEVGIKATKIAWNFIAFYQIESSMNLPFMLTYQTMQIFYICKYIVDL